MKKRDLENILFWSKAAAFGIGIILAFVFHFSGSRFACLVGLSFFAIGFTVVVLSSVFELVTIIVRSKNNVSAAADNAATEKLAEEEGKETAERAQEVVEAPKAVETPESLKDLRTKKVLAILKICGALAMVMFSLAVVFLF